MYIIKEKIYGNMATVFHRTSISDLVNKIYTSGFKPGDGVMYGRGFYSTYELKSQLNTKMYNTYGNIIVKFAVPISSFFIFDYEEFKKSPNFTKLGKPSSDNFIEAQFKFFKMDYSNYDNNIKNKYSSDLALWCVMFISNFIKKVEGIIFTGSRDGKVLVVYNTNLIIPLSYTTNEGNSWEDVSKNKEYLKKVSLIKNVHNVDLSIKPEDYGINNYEFDKDGLLNVFENVVIKELINNKLPFKFGKVTGSFSCNQINIDSLEGMPYEVTKSFYCSNLNLTSLKGCPKIVGEDFICSDNNLTSLENGPSIVGRDYHCNNNKLVTLSGSPSIINGSFDCSFNLLTSLKNGPTEVEHFECINNKLTSLEGGPKKVKKVYDCRNNNLKTLKGACEEIDTEFNCSYNTNLESIEYSPRIIRGLFACNNCRIRSLKSNIKATVDLNCKDNYITSLKDAPIILGTLYCGNNNFEVKIPSELKGGLPSEHTEIDQYRDL